MGGIIGNTKMVIKNFPNIGNNIQKLIREGKTLNHRVTGITLLELKEKKWVYVCTEKENLAFL